MNSNRELPSAMTNIRPTTEPITNPATNRASSDAPANGGHALDWKAISHCRALIVHLGPQLLAALFDAAEMPEPTPARRGASPVPDRDVLLFAAITVWSTATVDEVVPQPEASTR